MIWKPKKVSFYVQHIYCNSPIFFYLNFRTNHLNETIKHTGPFCLKRLPVEKTFVYGKSCNRLSMAVPYVFYDTVDKSINILL